MSEKDLTRHNQTFIEDFPMKRMRVPLSLINKCIKSNLKFKVSQDENRKYVLIDTVSHKKYQKPQSNILYFGNY